MAKRVWLSISSTEPAGPADRVFGGSEFAVLAAAVVFGAPGLLVGVNLLDGDAGLGLTLSQLVLVAPLGIVFAAVLVAATSWIAADTGVPFGLLQRPALGVVGAMFTSLLVAVLLVAWISVELEFTASVLVDGLDQLGVPSLSHELVIGALVVPAALLMIAGLSWVTRIWLYRFAFWAALALIVTIAWLYLSGVELGGLFEVTPQASRFWLGVDAVAMLGVLTAIVLADSGRFVTSPAAAASGGGTGVAVVGVLLVMLGGIRTAALAGAFGDPADALISGLTSFGSVMVVSWLVIVAVDQPFFLGFSAATSLSTIADFLAGRIQAIVLILIGASGAILFDSSTLVGLIALLSVVLATVVAVVLADFFVVRRRYYETDQLYSAQGVYSAFNWIGIGSVLSGCMVAMLLEPVGPAAVLEWFYSFLPSDPVLAESTGLPPRMIAMLISFTSYAVLGRWKIHDRVVMSRIRV